MPNSLPTNKIQIITFLFIAFFPVFVFAQDTGNRGFGQAQDTPEKKKGTLLFSDPSPSGQDPLRKYGDKIDLDTFHQEAWDYRAEGLKAQSVGDLDTAMTCYQKAVQLDPYYAVVYNDLGVIYEAKGELGRAEESYLRSVKISPRYLSAYTNLALLYENTRQLDKAEYYWKKRAQLGSPDDPWTQKARARLKDFNIVLSPTPVQDTREQEVLGLVKDVAAKKVSFKQDSKALSREIFSKAKKSFEKGDLAAAFKEALDAQNLDPSNDRIEEFIEKVQKRALSK